MDPTGGGVKEANNHFKRLQQFRKNLHTYKQHNPKVPIKGLKETDSTVSYLVSVPKVDGIDLINMKSLSDVGSFDLSKITIEYHMTLFYRNMQVKREDRQIAFFGRTARSRPIDLVKDPKTKKYATNEEEHIYFHSSLGGKNEQAKFIFLVMECVISVDTNSSKKDRVQGLRIVSGGYLEEKIFELSSDMAKPTVVALSSGTPRDLLTTADIPMSRATRRGSDAPRIRLCIQKFKNYDGLKALVPPNCFVTARDMVPGIISGVDS